MVTNSGHIISFRAGPCVLLLLFLATLFSGMQVDENSILETKVNLKVYGVEILESLIFRLGQESRSNMDYNTQMLSPYRAKEADYKKTTVRVILDEQLQDTPFKYRIVKGWKNKAHIELYIATH